MSTKFPLIAAIVLTLSSVVAAGTDDFLFPVVKGQKWGYINRSARIVIEPRFDGAGYFSQGLAVIKTGYGRTAKYGYVNVTGKTVIRPVFREAQIFSEGLAAVQIGDGKWGYIGKSGRFIIKPQFDQAEDFHNGLARVSIKVSKEDVKRACIDKTGKVRAASTFSEDMEGCKESGYIGTNGKLVIDRRTAGCLRFSEGLAIMPNSEEYAKFGYVDKAGKVVIKPRFAEAKPFSEGLAPVMVTLVENGYEQNRWGYIDKTGKWVVRPKFDDAEVFSDGLALVCIRDKNPVQIDLLTEPENCDPNKYGYIDKTGKFAIKPLFYFAENFCGGLGRVWVVSREYSGQPSYIDKAGKFVWRSEQ